MSEDFRLVADSAPIQLEQSGITLVAPGLIGEGACLDRREPGQTRAVTGEKRALDAALAEAELEDRHTLVIKAPAPAGGGLSNRAGGDVANDELLLQVPLRQDESAFVMYVDEAGVVSLHYRDPARRQTLPTSRASSGRQQQFRVRLRSGRGGGNGSSRAFFSDLVGKVIKVVVTRLVPGAAGGAVAKGIGAWERKHRAEKGLHAGTWDQLLSVAPMPCESLAALHDQRALLFIHGTTSTTMGAFGGLLGQPALGAALARAYDARLVAFGHQTMMTSVAQNVREFFDALAASPGRYTFDVICHSRGGLVARAITDLSDDAISRLTGEPWRRPAGVSVAIDRIVFVATPNAGTSLAIPEQIPAFVDRMANYVNMLPDTIGTIAASALLATAASLTEATLPRVPGLADQAPGSELLEALSIPADPARRFFAFQSEFAATSGLADLVKDHVMDAVFRAERNDLVVPTDGVSVTPTFTVPNARVIRFGGVDGVHHSGFFRQAGIEKIADALGVTV